MGIYLIVKCLNNKRKTTRGGRKLTDQLRRHFINAMFKVKKIDVCGNKDLSLPLSEMVVLKRLLNRDCLEGNGMNMSEIHHNLLITKSAVSQILNSLERKGHVNRYIDKTDRRRIMVTATPKAYDVVESAEKALNKKMNRIVEEFGEENMMILINQLTSLYELYEKIENEERTEKGEYSR